MKLERQGIEPHALEGFYQQYLDGKSVFHATVTDEARLAWEELFFVCTKSQLDLEDFFRKVPEDTGYYLEVVDGHLRGLLEGLATIVD